MLKKIIRSLRRRALAPLQRLRGGHCFFMSDNPDYRRFTIGRYTYGKPLVMGDEEGGLSIGSFCSIADGVRIILGGNHRTDWVTTYPFSIFPKFSHIQGHPASKGPVRIGNDVWIGQDSLILSGVTIGDGAVIGARSVVTRDVPPYAVAAGNPARTVKHRFSDEIVRELLELRWWDWPIERIEAHVPLMLSPDIRRFIEAAGTETKTRPSKL